MLPNALLIQVPSIDFGTFLGLSQQALGYSPSEEVDSSPINRSDAERFLECLAGLRKQPVNESLLTHVSFSVLVAADDRDMLDILQVASMPFVVTETLMRGVQLAVLTGTLAQWRNAVKGGAIKEAEFSVRGFFNRVKEVFEEAGLFVWKDFDTRPMQDGTLYLEYKG